MTPQRRKSVGVFTTDRALVVQSWDPWLADATGIMESTACGQSLAELFPELLERGLVSRLRRVADEGVVEVLAPAFHKYLLPCRPLDPTSSFVHMRQHVTLTPLRESADAIVGVVVTIEDVTPRMDRDQHLAAQLDSDDEEVRVRATQSLADSPASTSILSEALADRSWRVRRVAAEGMARASGAQAVDTLIEALRERHQDPAVLNSALTALSHSREDVVGAVIGLLGIDDAAVRTYAALALGLLEDSRGVPPLIALLADPDVNVRYHAIEALGRIGDVSAAEELVRMAETRDFFLAFAALDALAGIAEPRVAPRLLPLLDDDQLREPAAHCIGAIGSEEMAEPLALLLAPSERSVVPIAHALRALARRLHDDATARFDVVDRARRAAPPDATTVLIDALREASEADAIAIAEVLGWFPGEEVDQVLAGLLTVERTRGVAVEALARRGASAVPAVLAVANTDPAVRHARATVLGRIGSDQAVPELIRLLQGEPDVIVAAAGALGAIGDRRAFEPLLTQLAHASAVVRQATVSALNSIGHPHMEWAIAGRLNDPDPRLREAAARIAGYFGYRSAFLPLLQLANDADETVRRAAIEHLANFDDERAWPVLREALAGDPAVSVRSAAARAIGQLETAEATEALERACTDSNLWVRYFAVRTISRRGESNGTVAQLLVGLARNDPMPPVRIAAIETMAQLGVGGAVPALTELSSDAESEVACAAITALGRLGSSAEVRALTALLHHRETERVMAALDSLGKLRATAAVAAVTVVARTSYDWDLRTRAVATLAEIGSPDAITAMLSLTRIGRLRAPVHSAMQVAGASA